MMAAETKTRLIDRLPEMRGKFTSNAQLSRITWFRVGGPAEVLFRPVDRDDLAGFMRARPADVPVTVIGVGANILVRDGGIPGVLIRLAGNFSTVRIEGTTVFAGAGASDVNVSVACRNRSVAGLEFLSGIPGSIGAGLRMNAGAYGREMSDVVASAEAMDAGGEVHDLTQADLGFSYRHSAVPADWIFLAATLEGEAGHKHEISARMAKINRERNQSQPVKLRTGGSTFVNPPGHKAWELIEAAGCRGLAIGGARVSDRHCNFLINTGHASAADLENLGEEVRRRVRDHSGIELEWEIRRLGVAAATKGGNA
jgi:UDP-N-acetylmuramate dehydrogenase